MNLSDYIDGFKMKTFGQMYSVEEKIEQLKRLIVLEQRANNIKRD